MTYNVPTPPIGVTKWHVRVSLPEGGFIRILYAWNERDGSWYASFANDASVLQIASRRLVLGSDLLRAFRHREIPQGRLDLIDTTGANEQPLRDDLGDRVKLQYTPAA